jgi:hypothetical protein
VKARELPSAEYLRRRLEYNPDTGGLKWLRRPESDFHGNEATRMHLWRLWNARFAGKEAGRTYRGRRGVRIDGVDYGANRIIWKIYTGKDPEHVIDHINGDALDDRIVNLRDVPVSLNNRNKRKGRSHSGEVGVTQRKDSGRWHASVWLNNKRHTIGTFDTKEEAVAARRALDALHGFTPRHYGD